MGSDLLLFGVYLFLIIASLGFHEFGHAWVASLRGDDTAKDQGRVTLNPIAHIDPILTIAVPILAVLLIGFPFGGAKPVPVVKENLKNPRWDDLWVTLAGPGANLVLAVVFGIVLVAVFGTEVLNGGGMTQDRFTELMGNGLFKVLCGLVVMNLLLVVFNLLPVPPLDGSHVLCAFLPRDVAAGYQSIGWMGFVMLIVLLQAGGGQMIGDAIRIGVQALQLDPEVLGRATVSLHQIPGRHFG